MTAMNLFETYSARVNAALARLSERVVLPAGLTRTGLPVGLQVIAPHLADRTAIDVAARIGALVGHLQPGL